MASARATPSRPPDPVRAPGRGIIRFLAAAALLAACARGTAAEVLVQDGFEDAWEPPVPAGWELNGGRTPPDYYTRDTAGAHAGQACLRIRHPADAGWRGIDLDPARLPTRAGMIHRISFWARADRPGNARLEWRALQSSTPYVDTAWKGTCKLEVGSEWKEFTFALRDGLDLFADEGRFLHLAFSAAWNAKEDRTLWLDEVRVAVEPDPAPTGLLNDRTIAHQPLQHHLKPGSRLEFTVDPARRLRPATREAGGVAFHMVSGWTEPFSVEGTYQLAPLEQAIRDMNLPLTRIYAVGEQPFGLATGIDKVAEVLRATGIDQTRCVMEFEHQHANRTLPPAAWAGGVKHALERGYGFHHWEISNEPFSSTWGRSDYGKAFPTPQAYIDHFKAVAPAIRAADPQAQLGVAVDLGQTLWGNHILKQLAGLYDFVVPHHYFWADLKKTPFEEIVLTGNYRMLDGALRARALMRAYNPGREPYLYDTEWGVLGHQDGQEEGFDLRTANIVGTMHVAVRLIHYAREDILRGACGWALLSWIKKPANGILTLNAPDRRYLLYWMYYYFNRHVGAWALETEGTAPYYQPKLARDRERFAGPSTPVLATLSADGGEVYLVIANGSWSDAVPCRVHLPGFPVARVAGVVLSQDDPDGHPLLARKEDAIRDLAVASGEDGVSCTIPAHAVAFVTLSRAR